MYLFNFKRGTKVVELYLYDQPPSTSRLSVFLQCATSFSVDASDSLQRRTGVKGSMEPCDGLALAPSPCMGAGARNALSPLDLAAPVPDFEPTPRLVVGVSHLKTLQWYNRAAARNRLPTRPNRSNNSGLMFQRAKTSEWAVSFHKCVVPV